LTLAIFDLDNTLIGGDSDHRWGEFVVEKSLVDGESYQKANDRFYQDYQEGTLDMAAYVDFALAPLRALNENMREVLHREFMANKIAPIMLPKAQQLVESHRAQGHTLLIITATNSFITAPIAKQLNIPNLLATEPEVIDGDFTGSIIGEPCFQDGKVKRLQHWLSERNENMEGSFFYSDSFNDLPLLEHVSFPHAVDPDDILRKHAEDRQWPIISLR